MHGRVERFLAERGAVRTTPGDLPRPGARAGSRYLTVPGLDNSGPDHWQSRWDQILPGCRRVEMPDWISPSRDDWVSVLDLAIREAPEGVVLIGHSLGCLAIASWATATAPALTGKVAAAMLVAPPDVGQQGVDLRLLRFGPILAAALPFPSLVVASENDPYTSLARSQSLAEKWGSDFANAGRRGHLNAETRLGEWEEGLALLHRMTR